MEKTYVKSTVAPSVSAIAPLGERERESGRRASARKERPRETCPGSCAADVRAHEDRAI